MKKIMSNLENMLHSHDPETVRLALTAMGYKEDGDSYIAIAHEIKSNFGLLLYTIYGSKGYGFDNLALYDYKKKQDIRLNL
jgi:hypothetical protein